MEWRLYTPTNTGVPGIDVEFAMFGPQQRLWVAAFWQFFQEGGLGIHDFDTGTWRNIANFASPLPSPLVNDLAFAPDGSAWMATPRGLVRMRDGQFTVYRRGNSPLLHDWIANVAVDSRGHVWINNTSPSATTAALFEFDGVQWRSFRVGSELPWTPPWETLDGLLIDRDDHVWVGNAVLGGVAEFDGTQWVLHGGDRARMIPEVQDPAGNIWLRLGAGAGNGFYLFDGTNFTFFSSFNTPAASTFVTAIAVNDDDGAVLVGNWVGQVIRTADQGESWTLWSQQNLPIFSIAPDPRDPDVWVSTPGAVRRLDASGVWQMAFNSANTGIPDYLTSRVAGMRNGDVWFASAEFGASRFDGLHWQNFGQHNAGQMPWPFGSESADSIYEDHDGNVWIGSNGVGVWDGETLIHWDFNNSNLWPGMQVIAIAQDASGTIWLADKFAGVWRQQGGAWVQEPFAPPNDVRNHMRDLIADTQGRIWTINGGSLYRRDPGGWTEFNATNAPLTGPLVRLAAAVDGSIWIATGHGLFRFDGVNWRQFTAANSPLAHDNVHAIAFRPHDGLMAVAAADLAPGSTHAHGVSVVRGDPNDPANWTTYRRSNSPIPHYQITDVAFDADGDLWVATVEGTVEALLGAPGDIDGDGDVDLIDLSLLLNAVGTCDGDAGFEPAADFDGSGCVDLVDLSTLLGSFGA